MTRYTASVPVVMYYAEFLGLVMLWLGFYDFGVRGAGKPKTH